MLSTDLFDNIDSGNLCDYLLILEYGINFEIDHALAS